MRSEIIGVIASFCVSIAAGILVAKYSSAVENWSRARVATIVVVVLVVAAAILVAPLYAKSLTIPAGAYQAVQRYLLQVYRSSAPLSVAVTLLIAVYYSTSSPRTESLLNYLMSSGPFLVVMGGVMFVTLNTAGVGKQTPDVLTEIVIPTITILGCTVLAAFLNRHAKPLSLLVGVLVFTYLGINILD